MSVSPWQLCGLPLIAASGSGDGLAFDLFSLQQAFGIDLSSGAREHGHLAGVGLPAPHRDIDVVRIDLDRPYPAAGPLRGDQHRPAAGKGRSRMISLRREQSLIASATKATGLTVGCMASSSSRPGDKLLIPG
jgi:hypothetical protein